MGDPLQAFTAFWQYYEPRRDKLVNKAVTPTPLAAFYARMTAEQREVFGPRMIEAARSVATTGSFDQLDASQRAIGTAFGYAGLSYDHVFSALFGFRDAVFDTIVAEVGADSDVMRGLLIYIEHAVVHIGSAYNTTTNALVAEQRKQLLELSVPILQIAPRILLVPLLGELSTEKVAGLTTRILGALRNERAAILVLDLTGITRVEAQATAVLEGIVSAAR
jgi:rsbT co-antagonist protein RsbR